MQWPEWIRRASCLLLLLLLCYVRVAVAFHPPPPPQVLCWSAVRAGNPPLPWRPAIGAITPSSEENGLPASWGPWIIDFRWVWIV